MRNSRGGSRQLEVAPVVLSVAGLALAGLDMTSRVAELLEGGEVCATGIGGGGLGTRAVVRGPMLRRFWGLAAEAPFVHALDGKEAPLVPAPLLEPFPLTDRSYKHIVV